jgi:hypothetical protein
MNLTPRTRVFGAEDQSWLGSARGTTTAQPVTLATATFDPATHYPNGFLPSGLPLARIAGGPTDGQYGAYDPAAVDGRETLRGFLLHNARLAGPTDVAHGQVLDHGRVINARVPTGPLDAAAIADVTPRILIV